MGVGVFPHVARAPTEGFFDPELFFGRPVCLGYYENSHDVCVLKVINSSATSMCSII